MFLNIISGFFIQAILGFIAWTCWQVAAMYITIPSIPLIAGLALWFLWFMMVYVPLFSALSILDSNKRAAETLQLLLKKKDEETKNKNSKLN